MIKAVIFDLDGTLLNTLNDLANSVNYSLSKFGYPKRTLNEIRSFLGNGANQLIALSLPSNTDKNTTESVTNFYKKYYSEHNMIETHPYDGIIEILNLLKTKDIKLAIVSNKPDKDVKMLNNLFFKGFIDIAYGENESAGIRKKPYPDSVIKVLKTLKVSQEDAIYIGDSEVDIETAKNANIKGLFCTWGFRDTDSLKKSGAQNLIDYPTDILKFL